MIIHKNSSAVVKIMSTRVIKEVDEKDSLQEQEEDDAIHNNLVDPCVSHFQREISAEYVANYQECTHKVTKLKWPTLGEVFVGEMPELCNSNRPLTIKTRLNDFCLKENLMRTCETSDIFKHPDTKLSPLQSEIFSIISEYRDFQYSGQTHLNCEDVRLVYCLHVLNHVLKSKAKITHHNSKLVKNPDEEYRDQGYTRPTVLILAPFKESCRKIVNSFSLLLSNCEIRNKKQFLKEYDTDDQPPRKKNKPDDFQATFSGNTEEDFKIGISFKSKSMKLYSNFYASDVIIASPLGLRTIVGAEGDRDRDYDFLSSIEIFILDQADVLLMQNWMHVTHIAEHLNLMLKERRDCNFFRIRHYVLEGWAKFFRQNLLFSSVEHPYHRAILSRHGFNLAGYVRTWEEVKVPTISQVLTPVNQVFSRFESDDIVTDPDKRFKFFVDKILPNYKDGKKQHTLLYIPSYFDYVRLRNYFRKEGISAAMLCEYTESGKIAEGRNLFFRGNRDFMLYTERLHFYHRYYIRGVENIIFYQLPTFPSFYEEICNFLFTITPKSKSYTEYSCVTIFSRFDMIQMKHVLGFERSKMVYNSTKDTFMIKTV